MKAFFALCLVAALGCAYPAAAQPFRMPEELDLPVELGLRLALDQQIPDRDALHYVLWAGYRGGPENRPVLRHIVEAYEQGRLEQGYARIALSSLEFLGEDENYFLDLARRWNEGESAEERERRKWIAYYASLAIARRPTPEVLAALEEINARTSNGYLNGAFGMPGYIAVNVEKYEALPSVHEKIQMAVRWTRRGWSILGGLFDSSENLSPQAAVGQRWLAELSQQYPRQVSQAIAAIEEPAEPEHPLAGHFDEIRAYVASFTSVEVRALLGDVLRNG